MPKDVSDTKQFCIEMLPVIFVVAVAIIMHVLKKIYLG